jgi:anti-sigma regulatory factor (Ser/Thr protein kinase)
MNLWPDDYFLLLFLRLHYICYVNQAINNPMSALQALNRDISIQNNLAELERLSAFLDETGEEWGLSPDLLFHLNLVTEEVVSNIILYGYKDKPAEEVVLIGLSLFEGVLKVSITDHGIAFNPLNVPRPDSLDKPLHEREIGGLGVYFVRQMMDNVEYKRENDSNVLVLTKKI